MEPLVGTPHVSRTLVRRYMSFIEKIRSSSKSSLSQLLTTVQGDVRLTTGHNLRHVMLLTGSNRIDSLKPGNTDFEYRMVDESEKWGIGFLEELINVRQEELVVWFENTELEEIIEFLCTS